MIKKVYVFMFVIILVLSSCSDASQNIAGKAFSSGLDDGRGGDIDDKIKNTPSNLQVALVQVTQGPVVGEPINYTYRVFNNAPVSANNFSVLFSVDGENRTLRTIPLLVGGRVQIFSELVNFTTAGLHNASVFADPGNSLNETVVDNNVVFMATFVSESLSPVKEYLLSDWASFMTEGGDFLGKIVVGEDANVQMVPLANNIFDSLGVDADDPVVRADDDLLDTPVPVVALGSACDNSFIHRLQGYPVDCNQFEHEGFARLSISYWEDQPVLLLSGYDFSDVSRSVETLLNYATYLEGDSMCVIELVGDLYSLDCPSPEREHPCVDTDEGDESSIFGITWAWEDDFSDKVIVEDSCIDSKTLSEGVCADDGAFLSVDHTCEHSCLDGVCWSEPVYTPGFLVDGDSSLNMGDSLSSVKSVISADDLDNSFTQYLDDSVIALDDDNVEFTQSLSLPDASLLFGQDDVYGDDPVFYLDLSDSVFDLSLVFDEEIDFLHDLSSPVSTEIFGSDYVLLPPDSDSSDVVLLKSSVVLFQSEGASFDTLVDGQDVSFDVLDVNADEGFVRVRLTTGDETDTESVFIGELDILAGVLLTLEDIFYDENTDSFSVKIHLGGTALYLSDSSFNKYSEFETSGLIDSENMLVMIDGSSWEDVSAFHFKVSPNDFINPATGGVWDWLVSGESYTNPLFEWGLFLDNNYFDKVSPVFEFSINGDDVDVSLTNELDETFSFTPFTNNGGVAVWDELVVNTNTVFEDDVFILTDEDGNFNVSRAYLVTDISSTKVRVRDLSQSSTQEYHIGEKVGPSHVVSLGSSLVLDMDVSPRFNAKDGSVLEFRLGDNTGGIPKVYLLEDYAYDGEKDPTGSALYFLPGISSFLPYDDGWANSDFTLGGLENDFLFSVSSRGSLLSYVGNEGGFWFGGEVIFDSYVLFPNSFMESDDSSVRIYDGDNNDYVEKSDEEQQELFSQDADLADLLNIPSSPDDLLESPPSYTNDRPVEVNPYPPVEVDPYPPVDSLPSDNLVPDDSFENRIPEPVISSCQGCFFDEECFDKGFTLESYGKTLYCDGSKFMDLKKGGSDCLENYECKSNVCDNTVCSRNFWEKLLAVFEE